MRNDSSHEQEWRDWIKLTENKKDGSKDYSERLVEAIREAARDHYIRFGPHTLRRY